MKTLVFVIIGMMAIGSAHSQVQWKFSSKKIGDKRYEVRLTATIEEPWHIYAQSSPKGGPLPTAIVFTKHPLITLIGKPKEEGEMEIYHDETFDIDVYSYTGKVDFVQTIQLKSTAKTAINGTVEFMACTKQQCLTPEKIKFSVRLE